MKRRCVANMWFKKGKKRKMTCSSGESEIEIDFMLVGRAIRKYLRDVKVIPAWLQHRLVVTDLDMKVARNEKIEEEGVGIEEG